MLTEANAALSARALQLAQDEAAAEDKLRAVRSVSESEQTRGQAMLEEINLVQTESEAAVVRSWEVIMSAAIASRNFKFVRGDGVGTLCAFPCYIWLVPCFRARFTVYQFDF